MRTIAVSMLLAGSFLATGCMYSQQARATRGELAIRAHERSDVTSRAVAEELKEKADEVYQANVRSIEDTYRFNLTVARQSGSERDLLEAERIRASEMAEARAIYEGDLEDAFALALNVSDLGEAALLVSKMADDELDINEQLSQRLAAEFINQIPVFVDALEAAQTNPEDIDEEVLEPEPAGGHSGGQAGTPSL